MTYETRTISISINHPLQAAYDFIAAPENLPQWASGIGTSMTCANGEWFAATPQGQIKIRFAEHNSFGVLDHYVTPPSGAEIYIPMRVVANGEGCEVTLTLFRQPSMTPQQFADDAAWVQRDFAALKTLLEH